MADDDDGRWWKEGSIVRVGPVAPVVGSQEHEEYLEWLRDQFADEVAFKPRKYKPEFAEQVRKLYRKGWTDVQVAEFLEIHENTVLDWAKEIPEFAEARKAGKHAADDVVVQALYQRAVGYDYKAEKVAFDKNGGTLRADTVEHMPADPKAALNWLKNRRPDEWKDRREITGANGEPLHPAGVPQRSKIEIARRIIYHLQRAADEGGGDLKQIPQIVEERVTIQDE